MLEADIVPPKNSPWFTGRAAWQPESFVSYDVFFKSYWPHFSQSLTKRLGKPFINSQNYLIDSVEFFKDPSLVFNEFLGVIKGSELVLASGKRYLDQSSYENLGHCSQSILSSQRSTIYAIFEQYLKLKAANGQYDVADR